MYYDIDMKTKPLVEVIGKRSSSLKEGDIIEIEKGFTVYMELPQHFVYSNRVGVFDKTGNATVKVGDSFNGMDTDFLIGKYIVTGTSFEGGGTGMGPHDVYPSGHHVYCEKVNNNKIKVDFYQSGCFTAMNTSVKVVGKAKKHWEMESK